MDPRFLRIVYIAEFLLALIAVYVVWSEVGGQGHLDQMAWYLKLPIGVLIAYAIVRATSAAASDERTWNRRTLRWAGIVVLLTTLAAAITYFTHIYEPADEDNEDQTTTSMIR
jgi:hypothetical protein